MNSRWLKRGCNARGYKTAVQLLEQAAEEVVSVSKTIFTPEERESLRKALVAEAHHADADLLARLTGPLEKLTD